MKKIYVNPQLVHVEIEFENIIAGSVLENGEGSGGNIPEVKGCVESSHSSNPVQWDDWE